MSIAERIRQNSAYCMAGKDLVEAAILEKGGTVPENPESGVPTFANLVDGVYSIPSGGTIITAGNGSPSMEALAQESINQYDAVKVLINESADPTQFVGSTALPTTAKYDSDGTGGTYTTANVAFYTELQKNTNEDYRVGYISPSGNFVCVSHTSLLSDSKKAEIGIYPFYKVNGEYVQLKIDGVYKPFPRPGNTTYNLSGNGGVDGKNLNISKNPIGIDESNNIIVTTRSNEAIFYELDLENLNITTINSSSLYKIDGSTTYINGIGNPILIGKFLFFDGIQYKGTSYSYKSYRVNLDDDYNAKGYTEHNSNSTRCKIIGYAVNSNKVYIAVISGTAGYINTFSINESAGTCSTLGSTNIPLSLNYDTTKYAPKCFALNTSGTKMFIIGSGATTLRSYVITETEGTCTYTETTEADFTDENFDHTNVANAYITKDGMYIFAEINDTSLDYADRFVVLEYQFGETGGYKVLGYPIKEWSPALWSSSLPLDNCGLQLHDSQNMIFHDSTYARMIYKPIAADGKYLMYKSNNILSGESNVYGYGIAEADASIGDTASASMNVIRTI
jgi:hypothetical protein